MAKDGRETFAPPPTSEREIVDRLDSRKEGTAGQGELVYHQRFFNLSNLVLKARQLSPLFFYGLLVFLTFAVPFKKPFCMEKTVLHQAFWSF